MSRAFAISAGVLAATIVSALIAGSELRRVRAIARMYGHSSADATIVFALAVSSAALWYAYRDAPPGWHINIAEEDRWAQPAGSVAALVVYGLCHVAAVRSRRIPLTSAPPESD